MYIHINLYTEVITSSEFVYYLQHLEITIGQSSSSTYANHNIFSYFMEIKRKNEVLETSTYIEFLKRGSSTKNILLSTLDLENRQFQMVFLEPKV